MQDLGYKGGNTWGDDLISGQAEANNKRSISRDNVYSMAKDVWAGDTSFQEDFEEFDLTQILAGADKAGKDLIDESVDGKVDDNIDPVLAKRYVRNVLIEGAKKGELDEEQFTLLQGLISEWMLMKQERNFKQGKIKLNNDNIQALTRSGGAANLAAAAGLSTDTAMNL